MSGKYSVGGKKLSDAISAPKSRKTEGIDDSVGSEPTVGGTDKKNRKRKKTKTAQIDTPAKNSPETTNESFAVSPKKKSLNGSGSSSSVSSVDSPQTPSRTSSALLLRPSYLAEEEEPSASSSLEVSADRRYDEHGSSSSSSSPILRPIFVPLGDNSVLAFVPHNSRFSFKGKMMLTPLVGCLHCLGFVFGRNERRKSFQLFSPDSSSLLTVEDFGDGVGDFNAEDFWRVVEHEAKKAEGDDWRGDSKRQKVLQTYNSSTVSFGDTSFAPSVAILQNLEDVVCDGLSSFSGLFRYLFTEKCDWGKRMGGGAAGSGSEAEGSVTISTPVSNDPDGASIIPLLSGNVHVFHFDDDEEHPDASPWQRPTLIPTTHWRAIEQLVEDASGGSEVASEGSEVASLTSEAPVTSPSPLKMVIVGGKNCGKSTLCRVTMNALLSAKSSSTTGTPEAPSSSSSSTPSSNVLFPDGVFFLDADVGQCEFTPSSFVSLVHCRNPVFGPPFTHLAAFAEEGEEDERDDLKPTIVSMAFGGGNSPANAPSFYMDSVKRLYRAYENHPLVRKYRYGAASSSAPPLIVNTMGWNKGLGLTLMVDLLRFVRPSHVIQLDSSSVAKNFPPITKDFVRFNPGWKSRVVAGNTESSSSNNVDSITSSSNDNHKGGFAIGDHKLLPVFSPVGHLALEGSNKYRPPDLRLLALLAHWSESSFKTTTTTMNPTIPSILSTPPYGIPLKNLTLHIAHSKTKNSHILHAFNGCMVALGVQSPPSSIVPTDDPTYLGPRFFTASSSSPPVETVGLGIVRGIDLDAHKIYVSTFVSPRLLARVDTLLLGDMDLPAEIKQFRLSKQVLPTRAIKGGISCESLMTTTSMSEGEEVCHDVEAKPLPYMTAEKKNTIGSDGLGNTHKAPFRENKPGSLGRRNDLIRW